MKRFQLLLNPRVLAAAAVAILALVTVQIAWPGDDTRDVFRLSNEYKPAKTAGSYLAKDAPKDAKSVKDLIDFEVKVNPQSATRGETVTVIVTGMPRKGWHTYAMNVTTPFQYASKFKVGPTPGLQALGPIEETPPPTPAVDTYGTGTWEHQTKFTWTFDVLVKPDAKPGPVEFPFTVNLQVCSSSCIPGDIPLKGTFNVKSDSPIAVPADVEKRAAQKFPPPAVEKMPVGSGSGIKREGGGYLAKEGAGTVGLHRDHKASMERVLKEFQPYVAPDRDEGLMAFMLTGMFWGFVSLITPCVFPMIPITVSFFLKQSEKEHHKPVSMALVYCGTIVVVLTIAAAALLNFFRLLSISPVMNFGLGLLFVFFALSLFGMYEIELPSFLARYTSEREGRGGMVGTIFMALTFTIISFACVAPFLGGFGGTAATGAERPWWHAILGGLAFSVTFAAPFFILALFPTLLKAIPKSGAWLNSVKVVMGFLELAAAFKFFRAGELVWSSTPSLFTFDLVLGMWIALCFLCGLYLLGAYRLPHDSPVEHLSVPRMMFSFAFLGLAFYLMPALLAPPANDGTQRPNGGVFAWVNSFLLPESRPHKGEGEGEAWEGNLEHAIAQARESRRKTNQPKFIFVDFTGKTCTNCRKNENDVFSKDEFKKLFQPYVLVQLYTDIVPVEFYAPAERGQVATEVSRQVSDAEVNNWFEREAFKTASLPLYAILEPLLDGTVKVVGVYREGLINDKDGFAEFLRQPQKAAGTNYAAR